MSDKQVFVSHAPGDLDLVGELFTPIRNLPVDFYLAVEEIEPGRSRQNLEGRLSNADLLVSVLTPTSIEDHWVNQELGYATAKGVPILPLVHADVRQRGYAEQVEGVELDPESPTTTIFNLLSRLRSELEPIGSLSMPSWYLSFPCTYEGCGTTVSLEIEERQKALWRLYEHGELLTATCTTCGAAYEFNPATLGFIERIGPE